METKQKINQPITVETYKGNDILFDGYWFHVKEIPATHSRFRSVQGIRDFLNDYDIDSIKDGILEFNLILNNPVFRKISNEDVKSKIRWIHSNRKYFYKSSVLKEEKTIEELNLLKEKYLNLSKEIQILQDERSGIHNKIYKVKESLKEHNI